MKKSSRILTAVLSLIAFLSAVFMPLVKFDYQILFVGGEPLKMSLYKILTSDYKISGFLQIKSLEAIKTPLIFFSVFLMSAVFILGLIFVLSLFLNKPRLFSVVSSVGVISFIGAFISFMKARSLLLSGEFFSIENMVQIRAFDLQSGFYLAFAFILIILILNIISLKSVDKN